MNEPTMAFLKTSFQKYYQHMSDTGQLYTPYKAPQREWGRIPFSVTGGTEMYRHESIVDYDSLGDYLSTHAPAHIYHSVAMYDAPTERVMVEKGWNGADVVFDLDADHLEDYNPNEGYSEMLELIKTELMNLLDILERDLGFKDLMITFSGNRGYHVHVHDEGAAQLDKQARRQLVDYIRGTGFSVEDVLIEKETGLGDAGRKTSNQKYFFDTEGGWGRRIHESFTRYLDQFLLNDDVTMEEKIDELCKYDNVAETKAKAAINSFESSSDVLYNGQFSPHPAGKPVMRQYAYMVVEEESSHIDEPVTTDINRLIRLPTSLHGGSGLQVSRIQRDELEDFDPVIDAVPDFFKTGTVTMKITNGGDVSLDGTEYNFTTDETVTVPKTIGIFMMTRDRAEYIDHSD